MLQQRTRQCEICQQDFSYDIKRGSDRRMYSDFCRTKKRHQRSKSQPICVVEGCLNPRAYSAGICNGCYCRLQRTGTLEKRQWAYRCIASNGYVVVQDKTHHLAAATNGRVYEHRKILFDAIGAGPHPCHWCGTSVTWIKGKCVKGSLVADHLNGQKTDNVLTNLVPACNRCNSSRGLFMKWVTEHGDDPVLWKMYELSRVAV